MTPTDVCTWVLAVALVVVAIGHLVVRLIS
jgi:hypothetical protein